MNPETYMTNVVDYTNPGYDYGAVRRPRNKVKAMTDFFHYFPEINQLMVIDENKIGFNSFYTDEGFKQYQKFMKEQMPKFPPSNARY
jgi:hypothetical protein